MAHYQDSSPASIKYGELFVLGYTGLLPNRDEARTKSRYALCQRRTANGLTPRTVPVDFSLRQAISDSNLHSVCYTVSRICTVVVEYVPDSNTDMFQIGRSATIANDFMVTETVPDTANSKSAISRFACRIVCQRSPPYTARIYAAGFDNKKEIFLGENALNWKTYDGQMDGLTTNGMLVMHPLRGFTQGSEPGLWSEISVCGSVFSLRETDSPGQRGWMVDSESQELVDGSLIDLGGVTLLWRTAAGLERTPTVEPVEVQRQEIYPGRRCFVPKNSAKSKSSGAARAPLKNNREVLLEQIREAKREGLKSVSAINNLAVPVTPHTPSVAKFMRRREQIAGGSDEEDY